MSYSGKEYTKEEWLRIVKNILEEDQKKERETEYNLDRYLKGLNYKKNGGIK